MNDNPQPKPLMTEGECAKVAAGCRTYAETLEKSIGGAFLAGDPQVAKRLRAQISLVTLAADAIDMLLGVSIDMGLVPVVIQLKDNASATLHVHPIVAAELQRLRGEEPAEVDPAQLDIDDLLAAQRLEDQP